MLECTYSLISFKGRELPEEYVGLVYSQWLRSFRYGNDLIKMIIPSAYWRTYRNYLERILDRPDTRVRLAVLTDDKEIVLGFLVHRGNILDYVWTHRDHRNQKIAQSLLPDGIEYITHITRIGVILWRQKYKHWVFNPFA